MFCYFCKIFEKPQISNIYNIAKSLLNDLPINYTQVYFDIK